MIEEAFGAQSEWRFRMPRKPVLVVEELLPSFVAHSHSGEAVLGNSASKNHREELTESVVDFFLRYRALRPALRITGPGNKFLHGLAKRDRHWFAWTTALGPRSQLLQIQF